MRRLAIISGSVAVAIGAALATLPWWLGPAIAVGGRPFGLSFARYARHGYSHFVLEQVRVQRRNVLVQIERIEAETPLLWLWHRWTGRPEFVVAGDWTADAQPQTGERETRSARGWTPLYGKIDRAGDQLERWLPRARVGAGVVTWPKGQLTFAPGTWERRRLTVADVGYRALHAAAELTLPADGAMRLRLVSADEAWQLSLTSAGATISGSGEWIGQRADIAAQFPNEGWKPDEFSVRAEHWEIPGDRLKLGRQYRMVRGDGGVEWHEGRLQANLTASGEPAPDTPAPPLAVEMRGEGDARSFSVEALRISLPGVTAQLSDPVIVERSGRLRSGSSRFTFESELEQLPWLAAAGRARGEGQITADAQGRAAVIFSVAGEGVKLARAELSRVAIDGRLDWPQLTITTGRVEAGDGSALDFAGGWDFRAHTVHDVNARGQISAALVEPWIKRDVRFDTVSLEAHADGPWRTAAHSGKFTAANLRLPKLKPLQVEGEWRGRGATVETFAAEATAGLLELHATGSADREHVAIEALRLALEKEPPLELASPVEIRWRPNWNAGRIRLAGGNVEIDAALTGEAEKQLTFSARHVRSEWVRELIVLPPTAWAIDALSVQGKWGAGAAEFAGESALTIHLGPDRAAQIAAKFRGNGEGLDIEPLRIAEGTGPIVDATAHLPIVIRPAQRPIVDASTEERFTLKAATSPNEGFWQKIAELTGVEVVGPEARVDLTGSWNAPRGEAHLRAARISPQKNRFKWRWPKVENLAVDFTGDRDGLKLDQLAVAVEGQAVRASGRVPNSAERWRDWLENPREFLQEGEWHVEIPDADLAAIAQHIPAYLAPKGRLQLDLTSTPQTGISGIVRVRDAASRPLGPLGVLQDVNAEIRLADRKVELHEVAARMGGQRVALQGRAELPEDGEPRMELRLKGENLPFVRRTGLLLRGDLDLKLEMRRVARAAITGTIKLRDSLFLSDLRALIPSGTKGSATRPPYFSVDAPPVNTWRLDVDVLGEKFMRLRTPVFNGTASAHFHVAGTLGEPRATGEATIENGSIRLPFASFDVRQGELRLTPDQTQPQLLINGTTRRYGYDLRLELTGPVTAPNLTFTSSPPLAAEQVLLMVMAGQAPHDEITTTDRQRMARFGAFFGQSLLGTLGGDAAGADRLTISSGENISEQGRETYSIEYRLNDRWSLTGEYDEFDDYYGGFKWRIYTKGGRADEEP